jgi:fatty-acyl-CoA synthase
MAGLGEIVGRWARWQPDAPAVIDRGVVHTYGQLNERAARLAHVLLDAGCELGDRVVVLTPNSVVPIEALIATSKIGAIVVPQNPRMTSAEVQDVIRRTRPRVLIGTGELLAGRDARAVHDGLVLVVDDAGPEGYQHLLDSAPPTDVEVLADGDRPASMVFTGGTTGRPKGVVCDSDGLIGHAAYLLTCLALDPTSRFLLLYPHSSAGALNVQIVPTLVAGGCLVLEREVGFDAERFLASVERYQITHTIMVPTMLFRLLLCESATAQSLESLQRIGYGSAPIPNDRILEMVERFGPKFVQTYGQTEAGGLTHTLPPEDHVVLAQSRLGTCGRPLPGVQVKVVDENGRKLPAGEAGEIMVRSAVMARALWQDDGSLRSLLEDGGWLRTGDIGRLDEDEYLFLVDRKKDVIISGGFNVETSEVEGVIYSHPAILEAVVFGVPDAEWGELVCAFAALKPGAALTPDELSAHCRAVLSPYKSPRHVEIVEELPKSPMGKLLKNDLRDAVTAARSRVCAAG